jgi:hypothetical protein
MKPYLKLVTIFVNFLLAISIQCRPMFVFPPSFGVCLSALPIGVGVYLVLICLQCVRGILIICYYYLFPCVLVSMFLYLRFVCCLWVSSAVLA